MAAAYNVVLVTVPDRKTAEALAEGLVGAKLAACVNVIPGLTSVYWWEGKVDKAEELLLVAKTRSGLVPELAEYVRKNHPYAVPETISLPILDGNPAYLDWLGANTLFAKPPRGGRGPGREASAS